MGMFDSIYVDCPKCGETTEFQSKAGECSLEVYSLHSAPKEVFYDIMSDSPHYCDGCNVQFILSPGGVGIVPFDDSSLVDKLKIIRDSFDSGSDEYNKINDAIGVINAL